MLDQFLRFFNRPELPGTNLRFAVAASGGLDSMVLSALCLQAGFRFFTVHCNFQLRDAESERDEQFVRNWCSARGVEVQVKKFDTREYAQANGLSIQEAARELRYSWFRQLKDEGACDYVLLAHHANDSIETALMNYFRGTGLHGLTGIPAVGPYFLRPLLECSRAEIRSYAEDHGIAWVEDSSNSSSKYTRNFFRNDLLPLISTVFPSVEENLFHNLDRFQRTERLYRQLVDHMKRKIATPVQGGVKIPILQLEKWKETALLYELAKDFGFSEKQLPDIWQLTDSSSGKYVSSATHRIIRHRNHLIFSSLPPANTSFIAISEGAQPVLVNDQFWFSMQRQRIRGNEFRPKTDPSVAQVDAALLKFPLLLRQWRQGDYFYPLGMRKKKKLARFLIDQKLSLPEKERVWVLESEGKIVWVAGMRIDDRFKITSSTKEIISFSVASP